MHCVGDVLARRHDGHRQQTETLSWVASCCPLNPKNHFIAPSYARDVAEKGNFGTSGQFWPTSQLGLV